MFDYLIKNGQLIDGTGSPARGADVGITDGKIAAIGDLSAAQAGTVIDAAGKTVTPGFIDTHTHFEMNKGLPNETADDWVSGTKAAVVGGTTTVLDFAEPLRGHSLASALDVWHGRADGRASYQIVAQVMAALSTSGFTSINLITDTGGPSSGGEPR